jgi:hypothetical protein
MVGERKPLMQFGSMGGTNSRMACSSFGMNLIHYEADHLFSLLFANFELIISIIKTQHVFHIVNALNIAGAQLITWVS